MYVGRDFDPAAPTESEVFTLDFVNDLTDGDSIVSAAVTLTVNEGVDATPSSRLNGTYGVTGTKVMQRLTGLLSGVLYCLSITITTANGNDIELNSHVQSQGPF